MTEDRRVDAGRSRLTTKLLTLARSLFPEGTAVDRVVSHPIQEEGFILQGQMFLGQLHDGRVQPCKWVSVLDMPTTEVHLESSLGRVVIANLSDDIEDRANPPSFGGKEMIGCPSMQEGYLYHFTMTPEQRAAWEEHSICPMCHAQHGPSGSAS